MQDLIRKFDIKFVNLAKKKPKENNGISFLIEGNTLKTKAEEKGVHLEILKNRKKDLISEIKVSLNKTVFRIQEINRLLIRRHILTSNDRKL